MKILIETNYYLPGVKGGGPIKSLKNLIENISDDFEIYVITKSKDVGEDTNYSNIERDIWINKDNYKIMYIEKFTISKINRLIKSIKPDVIYLNSIFATSSMYTYPFVPIYKNIKFIVSPRGELNPNAFLIKNGKKRIAIKILKQTKLLKKVIFHATSIEEKKDISFYFPLNSIKVIPNLPSKSIVNTIKKVKIENEIDIVSVSRVSKMKNIDYFLEILADLKFGKIRYDIYGPIEDEIYYQKCKQLANYLPKNIEINFKGPIESERVPDVLKRYDLFVSTTLGENFGHSIIEAIQNKLPVLISNNTPWVALEQYKVGYDIDLSNKNEMIFTLDKLIKMNDSTFKNLHNGQDDFLRAALNIDDIRKNYKEMLGGFINE
ncbi:glycosyltransferase [Macrococcus capreoli]